LTESQKDNLKKQISAWNRRLQLLKEQKARLGIYADPHIDIEIEEIEAKLEELQAELSAQEQVKDLPTSVGYLSPREEQYQIVLHWAESSRKVSLARFDLSGTDLRVVKLFRADLRVANLSKADLRQANLSEADLRLADLTEVDARGANLRGANLSEASLRRANLNKADLSRADFNEADLDQVTQNTSHEVKELFQLFDEWDKFLSDRNPRDKSVGKATDLSGADLSEANLSEANLEGANLLGANLNGVNLCGTNLSDANLSGANLSRVKYENSTMWPKGFKPPRDD
jgi:uncharacterized protein YjbI with pentapeptide repeats